MSTTCVLPFTFKDSTEVFKRKRQIYFRFFYRCEIDRINVIKFGSKQNIPTHVAFRRNYALEMFCSDHEENVRHNHHWNLIPQQLFQL